MGKGSNTIEAIMVARKHEGKAAPRLKQSWWHEGKGKDLFLGGLEWAGMPSSSNEVSSRQ